MITITINENVRKFLRENKVFFTFNAGEGLADNYQLFLKENARIEPYTSYVFGNFNKTLMSMGMNSYTVSELSVGSTVGRYSSIAMGVSIMDSQHPLNRFTTSPITSEKIGAEILFDRTVNSDFNSVEYDNQWSVNNGVTIGNDVWVGQDVLFKSNVHIGDGAVIAARAVVTKDVPPYAVVGGVPARILKYRFPVEIIEKLLKLKWWDYSVNDFKGVNGDDEISDFIEKISELIERKQIVKAKPSFITARDLQQLNINS